MWFLLRILHLVPLCAEQVHGVCHCRCSVFAFESALEAYVLVVAYFLECSESFAIVVHVAVFARHVACSAACHVHRRM